MPGKKRGRPSKNNTQKKQKLIEDEVETENEQNDQIITIIMDENAEKKIYYRNFEKICDYLKNNQTRCILMGKINIDLNKTIDKLIEDHQNILIYQKKIQTELLFNENKIISQNKIIEILNKKLKLSEETNEANISELNEKYKNEIDELKQHIDVLKQENNELKQHCNVSKKEIDELKQYCDMLKEENNALKKLSSDKKIKLGNDLINDINKNNKNIDLTIILQCSITNKYKFRASKNLSKFEYLPKYKIIYIIEGNKDILYGSYLLYIKINKDKTIIDFLSENKYCQLYPKEN